MIDLKRLYHEQIEPRLFPYIGEIFPEFTLYHGVWRSRYKIDGTETNRPDKSKIADPRTKRYEHIRVLEQGGPTPDFIEFLHIRKGLDFVEAVKFCADIVGVEIPKNTSYEEKKAQERQDRQDRLREALEEMKNALLAPEGASVLRYLKEKRGYSDEYIEEQPFGFISPSMKCYETLKDILYYRDKPTGNEHSLAKCSYQKNGTGVGVGYTHNFAIAYIAEGEIKGFKWRTILTDSEIGEMEKKLNIRHIPKYYAAYIGEWDTQAFYPMALPIAKLTAYADEYQNFTLVEGELDTYRALYAGIPNVVGISQGSLTQSQLKKLKAKGAQSITLLMDTEAMRTEEGVDPQKNIKENRDRVAKAIPLIMEAGIKPYVFYLPSENGGKTDMDEYLKGLEGDELRAKGAEVWRMIREEADGGHTFLYKKLYSEHMEKPSTLRNEETFEDMAMAIIDNAHCSAYEKNTILSLIEEQTGKGRADLMKERAERLKAQSEKEAQQKRLKDILATAGKIAEQDPDGAVATLKETLPQVEQMGTDLSKYKKIKSQEERKQEQEGTPIGIYTDYTFYSKSKEGGEYYSEKFLLPSGALTYICAPSGHGKTRLLENIAFQVLRRHETGSVLFFTLEESDKKVENAFLNLFVNERLSHVDNNVLTLKKYKSEPDPDKQKSFFSFDFATFLRKERDFNKKYMDTGRLRIYYEPSGSMRRIEKVINYLRQTLTPEDGAPITAVFIDYIQRLKGEGRAYTDKKAEMNAVTEILMRLSVEMGIPFVLSVQLNRQAVSPLEMDIQNIADAAEIERSGSVILLGYNTAFSPVNSKEFARKEDIGDLEVDKETSDDCKKDKNTLAAAMWSLRTSLTLGKGGHIYAVLAKNRDSVADIEAVLDFEGNTGTIKQGMRNPERSIDMLNKGNKQTLPLDGEQREQYNYQKGVLPDAMQNLVKKKPPQAPEPDDDHPLGEKPTDEVVPY